MSDLPQFVVEGGPEDPLFFWHQADARQYAEQHNGRVIKLATREELGDFIRSLEGGAQMTATKNEVSAVSGHHADLSKAARQIWAEKPDLQAEFPDIDSFLAYIKAADKGWVNFTRPQTVDRQQITLDSSDHFEALARQRWDLDPAIRAEFGEFTTYVSFCRAEARNQVSL